MVTPRAHTQPFTGSRTGTLRALRAAHTSDPDDAFAWWAIATGRLTLPDCRIAVEALHIQDINTMCLACDLDIAAISSATYPRIWRDYALLSPGASVGRGYGPALATRGLRSVREVKRATVAVPGDLTTGALLLRLFFPGARTVAMRFDRIAEAISSGEVDAGVLIHEELLNWEAKGLRRLACLGAMWAERTGLPLPVGLNVVNRRLGEEGLPAVARLIRESMVEAEAHPAEARAWAHRHSIASRAGIADQFVAMFANEDTLALAPECIDALRLLFTMAHGAGLVPEAPPIDLVEA
jgi:1,4-dihydroxy-6-naphthoate synthase